MALITMYDGLAGNAYDTATGDMDTYYQLEHTAMRFHVIDQETRTAKQKFEPTKREAAAILRRLDDSVYNPSGWIHIKNMPVEFEPMENFQGMDLRLMAERDLRRWWGDRAEITNMAVRYLMYTSDGVMSRTPDAIGEYRGQPLIYKGLAVGTMFTVDGKDVMSDGANVAYWLPKPWWESFHNRLRGVPKEFPWPTGFVASNWCMRRTHKGYGDGIDLASMTQAHTLGSWSKLVMPNRSSKIAPDVEKVAFSSNARFDTGAREFALIMASLNTKLGRVGTVCYNCRASLISPYGKCSLSCGRCNCALCLSERFTNWCISCGMPYVKCACGHPTSRTTSASGRDHERQRAVLSKKFKQILNT